MSPATLIVVLTVVPIVIALAAVPALRAALARVLRERSFVAAAIVLAVAAMSLNLVISSLQLRFRKEPLSLSVPSLDDAKQGIPARVGHWVQVSKDEPLDHGTIEVLGTKEFVFRDYVDSRLFAKADLDAFEGKTSKERAQLLDALQKVHPEGVVRLAVTYYTGLVDTVPHVPEKCYVADGFDTEGSTLVDATVGTMPDGSPRQVTYSYLHFQDRSGLDRVDRDVAYLFHVNGHYASNNIAVRNDLADLWKKYGYFAKVEVMTTARTGVRSSADEVAAAQAKSKAAFNDLLTAVLPEVERCLPDWKKVTAAPKR
jgi:hypothetical protein